MELNNLSLKELWDLFPIFFVDYDDKFEKIYLEEERKLNVLLQNYIKRISHIGSTSIKNIKTKPIIDILIEIDFDKAIQVKEILLTHGYILMNDQIDKISFNKGYTINGYADQVFHVHIKKYGDCNELYFRDYLNDIPAKREEYENLKLELFYKYNPNRDLYTEGKSTFVNEIVLLAKEKYKNRYL
ncbi:MAG: GrpB family protein [Bacilli bacterium]|jgi:GrpB-like predicted nucleotidyltransferase (UPF0157 family)|nr:GrpB family protein [Bacilli bacterium]